MMKDPRCESKKPIFKKKKKNTSRPIFF